MSQNEEMREIVKSVFKKNTAKIISYFNENKKKMEETEAAYEAFERAKREVGGDIGITIASARHSLREEFEEFAGLITSDDEKMLQTVETLYQYFLLYERNK